MSRDCKNSRTPAFSAFCTIRSDGTGVPHRYYATKEAALRAARRLARRSGVRIEVAWCKDPGNPKLWLAFVGADGAITTTASWEDKPTLPPGWYWFESGDGILQDGAQSYGPFPTKDAALAHGSAMRLTKHLLGIIEVYEVTA